MTEHVHTPGCYMDMDGVDLKEHPGYPDGFRCRWFKQREDSK